MEYENVLLIGGPRDGKWITVREGVQTIQMAQFSQPQYSIYRRGEVPSEVSCKDLEYHRVPVPVQSGQGFKSAVFVFGDIDPMAALIAGYRRP